MNIPTECLPCNREYKKATEFPNKIEDASYLIISPDGTQYVTGHWDGMVKIWDITTNNLLKTLQGHGHWVYCVAFSPDGKTLASASEDGTVKLWDVATGQERSVLNGHTSMVFSVAFSPDGQKLYSLDYYGNVKIWNV